MAKQHKHGEMDVSSQEHAFDGFIRWSIRISCISIAILIFMAIGKTKCILKNIVKSL